MFGIKVKTGKEKSSWNYLKRRKRKKRKEGKEGEGHGEKEGKRRASKRVRNCGKNRFYLETMSQYITSAGFPCEPPKKGKQDN